MKFPSKAEFMKGLSIFEKTVLDEKMKVVRTIEGFKEDHPVFDEIIKRAIPFLPSPFNDISQAIYDSFEGSKEERIDELLEYLKKIGN
jgi:hypothetical protein